MPLLLAPITPPHALSWVRIRNLAYQGPTHDCIHTSPISDASLRSVAADWARNLGKKNTWHWRVLDTDLASEDGEEEGRTVGIAVWSMHNVPQSSDDEDVAKQKEQEENHTPFTPPEVRLDALTSLLAPLRAAQPQLMPPSHPPYLMLNQLATHPDHQRRGIGSMLLDWGLRKADAEGLVCYLSASGAGKGMYEKREFEVRKVVEWERAGWGGEGVDRYWCMVREVVKGEEGAREGGRGGGDAVGI
ncbi:hypothetical protein DE146DRAFT_38943 [Phaeosphaeria sp. MPI-PUGE-AT-0046c]|nr:hypothetical protein DE146DRAFT_38943 [Phaeosphaeria sp. MPI-PUGE-AT-0046c]